MTETELISSAQQGSLDAFNQLVMRYQQMVYNLAFWILYDSQTAEDITQSTFIKAFQSIRQFRGRSFRIWLLSITRTACLDQLNLHKNKPIDPLHPLNINREQIESPDWLKGTKLDQCSVEMIETKRAVRSLIQKFHIEYSHALILVDVLALDYAEAAEIMNVSIGKFRSRVLQARMALRSHLLQLCNEEQQYQTDELIVALD
jgi:RNA polymerase sigma-70 factor, ECF subfamily